MGKSPAGPLPKGIGWALAAMLFVATGVYGAQLGNGWQRFADTYGTPKDFLANLVGFRIEKVVLTGQIDLRDKEVLAAAGIKETTSLLFLDANEARAKLETLPLVKSATVHKLFPSTVAIALQERKPFALWQREGRVQVLAEDGTALGPVRDQRLLDLPFVVGEGAGENARAIRASLDRVPLIAARVHACVFVGERRWNLNLDNGVQVFLPEGDVNGALARLAELEARQRILEKDVLIVDMRLPDRIALRLTPDAASARAEMLAKKPRKGAVT